MKTHGQAIRFCRAVLHWARLNLNVHHGDYFEMRRTLAAAGEVLDKYNRPHVHQTNPLFLEKERAINESDRNELRSLMHEEGKIVHLHDNTECGGEAETDGTGVRNGTESVGGDPPTD